MEGLEEPEEGFGDRERPDAMVLGDLEPFVENRLGCMLFVEKTDTVEERTDTGKKVVARLATTVL